MSTIILQRSSPTRIPHFLNSSRTATSSYTRQARYGPREWLAVSDLMASQLILFYCIGSYHVWHFEG